MESGLIDLSKYRLNVAVDDLDTVAVLIESGKYKAAVNRSYYSIFHLLRAVTALDGFDSGKHSGIIAFFNKNYVKEGIFDKDVSKIIDGAYRLREKADYQDFYIVSKDQAIEQKEKAEQILSIIRPYLEEKYME